MRSYWLSLFTDCVVMVLLSDNLISWHEQLISCCGNWISFAFGLSYFLLAGCIMCIERWWYIMFPCSFFFAIQLLYHDRCGKWIVLLWYCSMRSSKNQRSESLSRLASSFVKTQKFRLSQLLFRNLDGTCSSFAVFVANEVNTVCPIGSWQLARCSWCDCFFCNSLTKTVHYF